MFFFYCVLGHFLQLSLYLKKLLLCLFKSVLCVSPSRDLVGFRVIATNTVFRCQVSSATPPSAGALWWSWSHPFDSTATKPQSRQDMVRCPDMARG